MKKNLLLLILLIEGAALMAVEIIASRLMMPFFGNSLFVWTSVLSVTILGLALGYFFGGYLSQSVSSIEKIILLLTALGGAITFFMPTLASYLIDYSHKLDFYPALFLTSILLIVPVVFCFGMIGPLTVEVLSRDSSKPQQVAGVVYFISSSSGILSALLFGDYLIPVYGLQVCTEIIASALFFCVLSFAVLKLLGLLGEGTVIKADKIIRQSTGAGNDTVTVKVNQSIIYIAIIEGASVMAIELIGGHMLAPYFGSSLYVWSAVLATTLLGLAIGYLIGSRIASAGRIKTVLFSVLLTAAIFISMMHITARELILMLMGNDLKVAVIIVTFFLLFPPIFCLGMVPTLLIRLLSQSSKDLGKITGRVYALSAIAGIVMLPLVGFYLIPNWGLTTPVIIISLMVGLLPFVFLLKQRRYLAISYLIVFSFSFSQRATAKNLGDADIKEFSEGALGQIIVADIHQEEDLEARAKRRLLMVNRMGQTEVDLSTGIPTFNYILYTFCASTYLPQGSNALLLGLGGGSLANMYVNLGQFNVDAVEMDKRIIDVSRDYFNLNDKVNVIQDDARHYLQTCEKKYDFIFFDLFSGEANPSHVLTKEAFEKASSLLSDRGFIIVNFNGFITGEIGKAGRSVYHTLKAAGLKVKMLPTPGTEHERISLFMAGKQPIDFSKVRIPLLDHGVPMNIEKLLFDNDVLEGESAVVYTDDKPSLDLLNMEAIIKWREGYNNSYTKLFTKSGVPLFK